MNEKLLKRCTSCGGTFALSGSGRGQKYCQKRARRGIAQGRGLAASNPLKSKGAETPFEEAWVDRLNRLKDREGPIALLGPDGELWRLWPGVGTRVNEARHWRLFAKGVTNAMTPPAPRKAKEQASPRGFRVRLCIDAEKELQVLGCGWRTVTCQFRGKTVLLHHNGNTATMKRAAFKRLISANRLVRSKRPTLRLVVFQSATGHGLGEGRSMNGGYERALMRLTLAERQLAQFDNYRDPDNPRHNRTLPKLRRDVEMAEADLRWAERTADGV